MNTTPRAVNQGRFDSYLRTYARSARSFGKTVWLRPFHEMNGNWYPWGYGKPGSSPYEVRQSFRRVVDIFRKEGATNVKFVWCPNTDSVPNVADNEIRDYWPGAYYVDILSIDGYNFGGTSWRSFYNTFRNSYAAVTALDPNKPVFIAEVASAPSYGSNTKAGWIRNMFTVLPTSFPRVTGFSWFNANKERDWRIESDGASLAEFRARAVTF